MDSLAVLLAAGRGERMHAPRPKAFLVLGGQPLLLRAALAFEAAASLGAIIVVVPDAMTEEATRILSPVRKLSGVVVGGLRRQDSVLEGLRHVPEGFDGVVLVHDAARPLVETALIEAVARAARESGAAIPVLE